MRTGLFTETWIAKRFFLWCGSHGGHTIHTIVSSVVRVSEQPYVPTTKFRLYVCKKSCLAINSVAFCNAISFIIPTYCTGRYLERYTYNTIELFSGTISETHEARFVVDAVIRQLFEMFRRLFVNGDSNKGIPTMDPMIFDYGELEYAGKTLK